MKCPLGIRDEASAPAAPGRLLGIAEAVRQHVKPTRRVAFLHTAGVARGRRILRDDRVAHAERAMPGAEIRGNPSGLIQRHDCRFDELSRRSPAAGGVVLIHPAEQRSLAVGGRRPGLDVAQRGEIRANPFPGTLCAGGLVLIGDRINPELGEKSGGLGRGARRLHIEKRLRQIGRAAPDRDVQRLGSRRRRWR